MKNIDAEIPFEVPGSWSWARLGNCFLITMGSAPAGDTITHDPRGMEFHQGKICFSEMWLKYSDTFAKEPSKVAPAMAVLLCVRAPVGTVNITDREVCIGRGLSAIVPLACMSSQFTFLWISTLQPEFIKKATGSTFIAITAETVKSQLIPIPPLAEQSRIINRLESMYNYIVPITENLN